MGYHDIFGKAIDELESQNKALVVALEDIFNMQVGNFKAKSCGHYGYCVCPWENARNLLKTIYNNNLIVALDRCIGSLRTVSPGGDGDPDVVFAREAIEEARKIK